MIEDLIILRHGKAEKDPVDDDFKRDLADKGKRNTQRVAVWLQQQQLVPDTIISSPANRALTTAQKCCKAMGLDARMITRDSRIYDGGITGLLEVLVEHNDKAARLMLVGHNPALDKLLEHLIEPALAGDPFSVVLRRSRDRRARSRRHAGVGTGLRGAGGASQGVSRGPERIGLNMLTCRPA